MYSLGHAASGFMSAENTENTAVHARVHGRVQGVGFRYFVQAQARRAGVRGWVRNDYDGSVEVVCEGPTDGVQRFIERLKAGPPGARVSRVEVSSIPFQGTYRSFTIEF